MIRPLHDPSNGPLRIAGLMSGSGTNLRRILELERRRVLEEGGCPFHVAVIFSDTAESQAGKIGKEFDLPVIIHDIRGFYAACGLPRRDLTAREEYDRQTVAMLSPFETTVAAYAGYMSVATPPLIDAFLGVNVHPADLSVTTDAGKRRFTGAHAVRDAILAGERSLRSTTHLIEREVDGGRLLMISSPIPVELPPHMDLSDPGTAIRVALSHQELLKHEGDWVVFPATLLALAQGRFGQDETGAFFFDGRPIPHGVRWEEINPA